jgi:hypothetical protein
MSRLNSGLHYGKAEGIFFPHLGCDLVARKAEPLDALLAIATDLLAQSEAQHRTTTRLDVALRHLKPDTRTTRDRASATAAVDTVRIQVLALRDLFETQRALLEELERELSGVTR